MFRVLISGSNIEEMHRSGLFIFNMPGSCTSDFGDTIFPIRIQEAQCRSIFVYCPKFRPLWTVEKTAILDLNFCVMSLAILVMSKFWRVVFYAPLA